ncbi:MAG: HlyD family efflux transporter periplasmic adaptor subunit [Pseudomonadota bacterium]
MKYLLPVLILALGVGGFQYLKASREQTEPAPITVRLPIVSVDPVIKTVVSPTLQLYGQVESPSVSVMTSAIEADVLTVEARRGNQVSRGDLLVTLDSTDTELQLLQRRAEVAEIEAQIASDNKRYQSDLRSLAVEKELLSLSQKEVERARRLASSAAGSKATLDNALKEEQRQRLAISQRQLAINDFDSRQALWEARLDKAKAVLKQVERDLARAQVRAPFDAQIIELRVSPGDRAIRGTQLVRLFDINTLEVRSQIPTEYVERIRLKLSRGEKTEGIAKFGDNQSIRLNLVRLASSIDQGQGGVDGFFSTQDALPELGRTLLIELVLPEVPESVVVDTDSVYGNDMVYVVTDGTLKSRKVRTLGQVSSDNGLQILLDGADFETGENILRSRLPQAIDGLAVEILASDR